MSSDFAAEDQANAAGQAGGGTDEVDVGFLCVADEFCLQTVPNDFGTTGFVSANPAEGSEMDVYTDLLQPEGAVEDAHPARPIFSRFMLHVANQYAASRQLQKWDERRGGDQKEREALLQATAAEEATNRIEQRLGTGQRAVYGGVYQLLAPTSGLFLTVQNKPAAELGTALRCTMTDDVQRSKFPWFRIRPGFRTRTEGEPVRMGDTVVLASVKMPNNYMHVNMDPGDGRQKTVAEVNLYEQATRFKIVPAAKHYMRNVENSVRAGSYVQLFQPQNETFLHHDHAFSRLNQTLGNQEEHSCGIVLYNPAEGSPSEGHDATSKRVDFLWQLNRPTMRWSGSLVKPGTREDVPYSLRDAVSGEFLSESSNGVLSFVDNDVQTNAHWFLRCFDEEVREISLERTGFWIENCRTGRRLGIGEQQQRNHEMRALKTKDASTIDEDDIFVFKALPADWLANFGRVLPQVNQLRKFCSVASQVTVNDKTPQTTAQQNNFDPPAMLAREPKLQELHTVYLVPDSIVKPKWSGTIPKICEDLLTQLTSSSEKDVLKRMGKVNAELQGQLTGLQMPHFLLEELLPTLFDMVSEDDIEAKIFGPHLLRMVQYAFRLLAVLATEHADNSHYLFDRLEKMGKYLRGYGFGVAQCVTAIVAGDPELTRKTDEALLDQFWELATNSHEAKYLQFFSSLVVDSSSGTEKPVKFNQDRVVKLLREKIPVGLYSTDVNALARAAATDEGTTGKARLKAAAKATREMNGTNDVHIKTVYSLPGGQTKLRDVVDFKAELDFHVGLIDLTAYLCMGRHRDSIDFFLQDERVNMSYSLVLARSVGTDAIDQTLSNGIPCAVRRAYTFLMRTLFIDREPLEYLAPVQTSRIMPPLGDDPRRVETRLKAAGDVSPRTARRTVVDPYEKLQGVERPTPGFTDLISGILEIFRKVQCIDVSDIQQNLFLLAVVKLAHEMLLFGMFDRSNLPPHLFDGVMVLGEEAKVLGRELLNVLNGQSDDMSKFQEANAAGDADTDELRFDPRFTETSTVMALRKTALALIVDLFGLRASKKVQLLLEEVGDAMTIFSKDIEASASGEPIPFEKEESPRATHHANPLSTFDTDESPRGPPAKLGSPTRGANGTVVVQSVNAKTHKDTDHFKVAQRAMEKANEITVYDKGDTTLTAALLDMLRYTQDLDLCFGAFNALVFFISQNFVFVQTLKRITILGTEEETLAYLAARRDVSEFRRLRKWLHKKKECLECAEIVDKMIEDWCATPEGQNLLRELNLEEYILRVFRIRLDHNDSANDFKKLKRRCLHLVAALCRGNQTNQERWAAHMERVLIRLLRDKEYYVDAAAMLSAVVADNEAVSVAFSSVLVSEVGTLAQSPDHGRSLPLLQLLEELLVVNDKPVPAAQIKVCKGAVICPALIETEGDLAENEWCAEGQTGAAMDRYATIKCAASDDGSEACKRCQMAIAYYSKCLELLGICSRGDMPSTELLCASILSFEECILRLNELYSLQEEIGKSSIFITEVKAELLTFFVDVFVDTTSEYILVSVRRARNGIWTVPDTTSDTPIATRMLNELKVRLDQARLASTDVGALAEDVSQLLFEEAVLFFIHFACCVGPKMSAPEEQSLIRSVYTKIRQLTDEGRALKGLSYREKVYTDQLYEVATAVLADDAGRLQSHVVMNSLASKSHQDENIRTEPSENAVAWQRFVAASIATVPVTTVAGTSRLVGRGIMTLAQALWKPTGSVDHYAGCLVSPLRARVQLLIKNPYQGRQEIPKLLAVLDTVRAIPYSATAFSSDRLDGVFHDFADVVELDCRTNPYLAAVQKEMVAQGWAMLCLEILFADELAALHLAALRLMLAMTGGGNIDVQDALLKQLTDVSWCPREIFAASCRKLLHRSLQDLKIHRKRAQLVKAADETDDTFKATSEVEVSEVGHVLETLGVLSQCCKGAHSQMQDYIRDQPGHKEQFHLINDVVFFINQLERDVKDDVSVDRETGTQNFEQTEKSQRRKKKRRNSKKSEHYVSNTIQKSYAAFYFLESMATGPHYKNQLMIANSDLIPVINRMLTYTVYEGLTDVASAGSANRTAKGQIHSQITRLLLTLLEGVPQPDVIQRLLSALDWKAFGVHLSVLKDMMMHGTIAAAQDVKMKGLLFDDDIPSPRSTDEETMNLDKRRLRHDVDTLPPEVSDPKKHICAEWMRKEAFRFFTILEQIRVAGERMERSGNRAYKNSLEPLDALLTDDEMMSFFHERVGHVEVIRDGVLERLFFLRPANCLVNRDRQMLVRSCTKVVDAAPRQDSTEKLNHFLEGAIEIVAVLQSQDHVTETFGKKIGWFLPRFFAWSDKKNPTLGLSVLICLNLMASYTQCDDATTSPLTDVLVSATAYMNMTKCGSTVSLSREAYSRAEDWPVPILGPIGFELAIFLGSIHVILTVMRAYSFLIIRFPVIVEMYDRKDKLDWLTGSHADGAKEREEFISASVLVYGLPEQVPDDSLSAILSQTVEAATRRTKPHLQPLSSDYVSRLFTSFGPVGVCRVVRVKQKPDENGKYTGSGNSSWALVKFEKNLVGKLTAKRDLLKAQDKALHPDKHGSDNSPSPLTVSGGAHGQAEKVSIVGLTPDEVDRSTTLKEIVREAMVDYKVANKDAFSSAASSVQTLANALVVGRFLPIDVIARFRKNAEVHDTIMDIAFSVLGFVYNPLFFSYHLLRIRRFPGAGIVIMSITHNIVRLAVALVLALLFAWVFAISGMLLFQNMHDPTSVENEGGPCGNLLTCFFSYSYAALTMEGLEDFVPGLKFPVDALHVVGRDTSKTLWELLFFLVSTLIGSIITGIICDTFGELRAAQDEAAEYRSTTNFVTGIPFARTGTTANHPAQQPTNYIQYAWFLLYLQQRDEKDLTPLETEIKEKIAHGDISWLPDGRCSLLENNEDAKENTMNTVVSALESMQAQHDELRDDVASLQMMMEQALSKLSKS